MFRPASTVKLGALKPPDDRVPVAKKESVLLRGIPAKEECTGKFRVTKVRVTKIGIDETCASEVGVAEVRVAEVRTGEVHASELCRSEVRAREIRAGEINGSGITLCVPAPKHRKGGLNV